jgi:hypothetical protein
VSRVFTFINSTGTPQTPPRRKYGISLDGNGKTMPRINDENDKTHEMPEMKAGQEIAERFMSQLNTVGMRTGRTQSEVPNVSVPGHTEKKPHPYWNKVPNGGEAEIINSEEYFLAKDDIQLSIDALAEVIGKHMEAQGFWDDENDVMAAIGALPGGTELTISSLKETAKRWKNAEKYMLIATELTECIEGDRAGQFSESNKIVGFTQLEEEMADIIVRVLDFAHRRKLRIGEAFIAKMEYNAARPFRHGKKF